jgi:hypothetical protein
MEATDFCRDLPTSVFGGGFEAEEAATAGPFEKKDVNLFCFFSDIVVERGLSCL